MGYKSFPRSDKHLMLAAYRWIRYFFLVMFRSGDDLDSWYDCECYESLNHMLCLVSHSSKSELDVSYWIFV